MSETTEAQPPTESRARWPVPRWPCGNKRCPNYLAGHKLPPCPRCELLAKREEPEPGDVWFWLITFVVLGAVGWAMWMNAGP